MSIRATAKDVGRAVVYRPSHGEPERGVITSVGRAHVFVRYGTDQHSKATRPDQLEWANSDKRGAPTQARGDCGHCGKRGLGNTYKATVLMGYRPYRQCRYCNEVTWTGPVVRRPLS